MGNFLTQDLMRNSSGFAEFLLSEGNSLHLHSVHALLAKVAQDLLLCRHGWHMHESLHRLQGDAVSQKVDWACFLAFTLPRRGGVLIVNYRNTDMCNCAGEGQAF